MAHAARHVGPRRGAHVVEQLRHTVGGKHVDGLSLGVVHPLRVSKPEHAARRRPVLRQPLNEGPKHRFRGADRSPLLPIHYDVSVGHRHGAQVQRASHRLSLHIHGRSIRRRKRARRRHREDRDARVAERVGDPAVKCGRRPLDPAPRLRGVLR
jgi:hypothetical protein